MRGLEQRLSTRSPAPLAVAFSGGGDSLALLLIAAEWAGRHGRRLVALHVDHRLNPESRRWAEACAARADALGLPCEILPWTGEKPGAGLPAAARRARHKLLADAARRLGAHVILMGHTASDLAEAAAMRAGGSTVPDPREWSPSPAWPEGRGLFLYRPLLARTRADLRAWLRKRGETWIDDPANEDPRYARARARAEILLPSWEKVAGETGRMRGLLRPPRQTPHPSAAQTPSPTRGEGEPALTLGGGLELARAALTEAEIAAACLCAAGSERPPRGSRLAALAARLAGEGRVTATLAGARIEADAGSARFLREAGEAARGGLAPVVIEAGANAVWDGRFEISAERAATVRAARGLIRRLPTLSAIPADERGAYPVLQDAAGEVSLPAEARPLALERFRAAMGLVTREPG